MTKIYSLKIEISNCDINLFSDFLLGIGSYGVSEEITGENRYKVLSYFPLEININTTTLKINSYLDFLRENDGNLQYDSIEIELIDSSSWNNWKNLLKTVKTSNKVIIRPPWESYQPQNDEVVIEINPSLAFGTGHHETTRLCIKLIEYLTDKHQFNTILDVGCGSGILSIAALRLGIKQATAIDIDPVAVIEAKKNFERNHIKNENLICADIKSISGKYQLIVANISDQAITNMRNDLFDRLEKSGYLIISGIPVANSEDVLENLLKMDFTLEKKMSEGDWYASVLKKI